MVFRRYLELLMLNVAIYLLSHGHVFAAEKITRLQCVWKTSQDLQSRLVERARGAKMLVYRSTGGTNGQLSVEGVGVPFSASMSEVYLQGDAKYKTGSVLISEKLEVNRFTGAVKKWQMKGNSGGLYEGECLPVAGPLF